MKTRISKLSRIAVLQVLTAIVMLALPSAKANTQKNRVYKGSFTVLEDNVIDCSLEKEDQVALYKRLNVPYGDTLIGPVIRFHGVKKIYMNNQFQGTSLILGGRNVIELQTDRDTLVFELITHGSTDLRIRKPGDASIHNRGRYNVCLLDISEIISFLAENQ